MDQSTKSRSASAELAAQAGQLLAGRRLTLAVAESCTGGLLASWLTDVPGSSDYFLGGVVAYANLVKENILGVRHETLLAHGAVSAETASEMAWGVRRLLRADISLAITGVAGPGGGTPEKPVGLAYLHLSAADAEVGERHVWDGDRAGNKERSTEAAVEILCGDLQRITAS